MEQKNEQLKQSLINQYSRLSLVSKIELSERLQDVRWWNKEKSSLKVQNNISLIGSCLVFLCCCFVIVFTLLNGSKPLGTLSVPIISFAGLIFALVITEKVQSKIKTKIRVFELLHLLLNNTNRKTKQAS